MADTNAASKAHVYSNVDLTMKNLSFILTGAAILEAG